jgi:hypothetical protein
MSRWPAEGALPSLGAHRMGRTCTEDPACCRRDREQYRAQQPGDPLDVADLLIVRLSRPLPSGFGPKVNSSLSHRHLDLVLHGMRAAAQQHPDPSAAPRSRVGSRGGIRISEPNSPAISSKLSAAAAQQRHVDQGAAAADGGMPAEQRDQRQAGQRGGDGGRVTEPPA